MKNRKLAELKAIFDAARERVGTVGEYCVFSRSELKTIIENDPVLKLVILSPYLSAEQTTHFANFFFTCGAISAMKRETK